MTTPKMLAASLGMVAALVAGCGTTSDLKSHNDSRIDFTRYDRVLVRNFNDEVSAKAKASRREAKAAEMSVACVTFAEQIAANLRLTKAFQEVTRDRTPDGTTLIVSGSITRYAAGDPTLRLMIGMGAGSSYFDARVDLIDGSNNGVLGSWLVDKNSWVLGGGIASTQTPEAFMREVAGKVALQLAKAKRAGCYEPPPPPPKTPERY